MSATAVAPAPHSHVVTQEERNALAARARGAITINGESAILSGLRNRFATVRSLKTGISADFAWKTVRNVLDNRAGNFFA